MKRANKGRQPEVTGERPAEFVEKRPSAKGNPGQTTVTGTQSSESATSGLDRIREAAKWDKKWTKTEVGTPQGAVLSPLLANIYLRYVLALWVNRQKCVTHTQINASASDLRQEAGAVFPHAGICAGVSG
jgi:hypothetical protein